MDRPPAENGNEDHGLTLRLTLIVYGALTAAAFIWGFIAGRPFIFTHPRPDAPPVGAPELLLHIAAGLIFAAAVVILSGWTSKTFLWARRLESEFARIIGRRSTRDIIVMAACSGLAEELFFRGAMQPTLGLTLSSLIFGLLHMGPSRQFWPWTVFALVIGFVLGWFFEESGTLAASITAHSAINLANMLRLRSRWYSIQTGPQSE